MNVKTADSINQTSVSNLANPEVFSQTDTEALVELLLAEMQSTLYPTKKPEGNGNGCAGQMGGLPSRAKAVVNRIALEVERICAKSDRI
ncbi:MAG TPA: hypothetical protein DD000_21710, partial [Cyanobacteria bacterium UBA11166]|nr:hypothetical protein [Cyanobacteria bacterium UBA11166]